MFGDRLEWRDDHFVLEDFVFRLQHQATDNTADDAFLFYKDRGQVEQFERFFTETGFRPRRVLELGIWDGGSAAFWTELLDLDRYAGIDLQERGDSTYFAAWNTARGRGRVSTHWGVSQTDRAALLGIIDQQIGPLDLVLDDCSHQYGPTRESMEILFPLLRPGGWYVIEDWAWDLQPAFQPRDNQWGVHRALSPLATEIIRLSAARPDVVASVRVSADFVAVERGSARLPGLDLSALTPHRSRPWEKIAYLRARRAGGQIKRRLMAARGK